MNSIASLLCFIALIEVSTSNGFLNLNLETLKTRALGIADLSATSADFDIVQLLQPSSQPLTLYPDFEFRITNEEKHNKMFYITNSPMATRTMCTPEDFTLGVWRLTTPETYTKVVDLEIASCEDYAYSFNTACCEFTVPSDVANGDILGILHGPASSLLHEVAGDPQLEVLFGEDGDSVTGPRVTGPRSDRQVSRRGYPLLTFKDDMVSNTLSYDLVKSLFTKFNEEPLNTFGFGTRADFTCEGRILSWHIVGIPMDEMGNQFTLRLKRMEGSERDESFSVFTVNVTTIAFEDIQTTAYPNVYKISTPEVQFVFRRGDYVSIAYDRTQPTTEFAIFSTQLEDLLLINNVELSNSILGATMNFPLLSLEVASNDCEGNAIFYDPVTLANRALTIQDTMFAPLSVPDFEVEGGYLYIFPNISFTENGFITLWRFGGRVNGAVTESNLQYPNLQVWRQNGSNMTLVSSSDNTMDPALELRALHVYRYDVNLTYEEGDFIAVYQPPISRSKYLLTFADSSNFRNPITAFEISFMNEKRFHEGVAEDLTMINQTVHLVEPVMSIVSTSMPNDTEATKIVFKDVPFDQQMSNPGEFEPTTSFVSNTEESGLEGTLAISVSIASVVVVLLVVILGLALALYFTRRRYKKSGTTGNRISRRQHAGRANLEGSIDSASYAIIRATSPNNLRTAYYPASIQSHEVPPLPPPALRYYSSEASPNLKRKQIPWYSKAGNALPPQLDKLGDHDETLKLRSPNVSPAPDREHAYETPISSRAMAGFQCHHSNDFQNGVLSGPQAYEVPTVEVVGVGKPHSNSLEHSYENSDIGIYDCGEDSYDDALYVPTERERRDIEINSISNIYYTIKENQKSAMTSASTLFEESDKFWHPANETSELYQQMAMKKYREIPRNQIQRSVNLGSGQFGAVFKGMWKHSSNMLEVEVAIKILKNDVGEKEKVKFLQEGAIIGQFQHPNVVKLHGMVTLGEPAMIILELLPNGDLHNFLNMNRPIIKDSPKLLLSFCQNIAAGMEYLSSKGFVHRDLAARNILLTENHTCKITDFGMSRNLAEEDYYISHGGMIPVKWTAPEALSYRKYSTASDVWSFGVLMYEIWSVGYKPFAKFENMEVVKMVMKGHRLKSPPGCPREIYKMMMTCWHPESSGRPPFADLLRDLYKLELELRSRLNGDRREFIKLGDSPECSKKLYTDLQGMYLSDH